LRSSDIVAIVDRRLIFFIANSDGEHETPSGPNAFERPSTMQDQGPQSRTGDFIAPVEAWRAAQSKGI
jgi:hypothetical protein